jgi:hypothetical protein
MTTCSDIVSQPIDGAPLLCEFPANSDPRLANVIAFVDGRAAILAPNQPTDANQMSFVNPTGGAGAITISVNADERRATMANQGVRFLDCNAVGAASTIQAIIKLPPMYNGTPITWGPEHMREINRIMGSAGQANGAFICSDGNNVGQMALNSSGSQGAVLGEAIKALDKDHGTLDDAHYNVLMASLRRAAGMPETSSFTLEKIFGIIMGVAVLLAFGPAGYKAWIDVIRRKGPPNDPGQGGGGGGGLQDLMAAYERGFVAGARGANPAPAADPAPTANPNASPRVRLHAGARAILAITGGSPNGVPTVNGVAVPSAVNGTVIGAGVLPAPVLPPPVAVPSPVVVTEPGLVPALP